MIDKIKESCSSSSVNLSEIFAKLTNDVVCRVALGRKYGEGEGGRKFKELLGEFGELLGAINVGDYIPSLAWLTRVNGLDAKAEKVAKQLDDFLEGVIEEHINCQKKGDHDHGFSQENEDRKDFVDILLWIQEENVIGFPIDRVSIKALILERKFSLSLSAFIHQGKILALKGNFFQFTKWRIINLSTSIFSHII